MKDPREKILDAFLDEMLNDVRPSRSSAEILRYVKANLGELKTTGNIADPDVEDTSHPATIALQAADAEKIADSVSPASAATTTGKKLDWISILSIATVLIAAAAISIFLLQRKDGNPGDRLANDPDTTGAEKNKSPETIPPRPNIVENDPAEVPDALPKNRLPVVPETEPRLAIRDDVPVDQNKLVLPPDFKRAPMVNVVARSPLDAASTINGRLFDVWEDRNVLPARPLDPRKWVNRLSSRVIGRALNADEMSKVEGLLVQSKSPELIRQDLTKFLMDSPEYQSEFAEHWGQVLAWKILGISPTMTTSDVHMVRTSELIAESIRDDDPLDKVVYELVSAVGSTIPDRDDYNPAASYLVGLTRRFGTSELSSAHVADAFLGLNSQCAQCHDRFGDETLAGSAQREFFQFHSFFAQLELTGVSNGQFNVVNRNFLPLAREGRVEAAFKYKDTDGREFEVFPKFGDFEPATNGFVAKVDRRTELAKLIAGSREFRETMVDHVWASMLNLPLSGIDGRIDPAMAELRAEIGEQFAANDFDVQWLVSTIASSNAFAVGVGTEEHLAANNPFLGKTPHFNVFYSRLENRRSAIGSLTIVANAYSSGNVDEAMSAGLLARIDESIDGVPKFILPFVPSKDSEWATSPIVSQQLELIAASDMAAEQKIKHIVQAALGRSARDNEIMQATIILENGKDQRTALQDVWWSLLNSVDYKIPLKVR